jgi:hypothetical protein
MDRHKKGTASIISSLSLASFHYSFFLVPFTKVARSRMNPQLPDEELGNLRLPQPVVAPHHFLTYAPG